MWILSARFHSKNFLMVRGLTDSIPCLSAFSRIFNQSASSLFDFGDVQHSLGMFTRALPKSIFFLVCGGLL